MNVRVTKTKNFVVREKIICKTVYAILSFTVDWTDQ